MTGGRPRGWRLRVRRLLIALVALEVGYLVVGNVVLSSGLIPHLVERSGTRAKLEWNRAWTVVPGYATVEGFRLQLEDESHVQIDLRVAHATTRFRLWKLLKRRVSFDGTRAEGVAFRMVTKVDATESEKRQRRVAAFPTIEGLTNPPVKPERTDPEPTEEEIDALFGVEMTDVMSDVCELWFDEYRYQGPSHANGGFALLPLKELWVGPAVLTLDGGALTAGKHTLLPKFTASVEMEIGRVSLLHQEPPVVFTTMKAAVRSVTDVEDVGAAELYLDGLELRGHGRLKVSVKMDHGKVTPESDLKLDLEQLAGASHGFSFAGHAIVDGFVTEQSELKLGLDASGQLTTPVLEKRPLVVRLESVTGELVTVGNDFHEGPGLLRVSGRIGDARADDAMPVTEAAGRYVPIVGPAVLGAGPLTGSVGVTYTPTYTVLRFKQCQLGQASLVGAMVHNERGWNGAAAGLFAGLPIGLLVNHGELESKPPTGGEWLGEQEKRLGIAPESMPVTAGRSRKGP